MITFEQFSPEEGMPIYLQIVRHIKRGIVSGAVVSGDEVPSRRVLSALLGVNPNTVQKAYAMLESEGLMTSHAGAKSCMVVTEEHVAAIRRELLENDALSVIAALRQMGLSKQETIALIETYWE
ncbi:MAG: GntR family transcriptional regulator [Clostridia bacterium]|nr:GntR family transcriptional regulator [Clostridia bacterium]